TTPSRATTHTTHSISRVAIAYQSNHRDRRRTPVIRQLHRSGDDPVQVEGHPRSRVDGLSDIERVRTRRELTVRPADVADPRCRGDHAVEVLTTDMGRAQVRRHEVPVDYEGRPLREGRIG